MKLAVLRIIFVVFAYYSEDVFAVLLPTPSSGPFIATWEESVVQATQSVYQGTALWKCDPFEWEACPRKILKRQVPCVCGVDVYNWLLGFAILFGLLATLVLLTLISLAKNASPDVQEQEDGDHHKFMADRLIEAKRLGYLRRLQVSGPLVVMGVSLVGGGIPMCFIYLEHTILQYALPVTVLGYVLVVAGLLPTDTISLMIVSLGAISVLLTLGAVFLKKGHNLATMDIPYYRGREGYKHYRTFEDTSSGLLDIGLALYIVCHLCFSPTRRVFHRLWIVAGVKQLYKALVASGTIAMKHVYNLQWISLQWKTILFSIAMGYLIGFACLTTRLRHFIRDLLRANSEAAAAAAGIAELVSSQDPRDVLERAKATFMCVPADSLTQEDMADSKPDPRLRGLAERVQLGDCDAFISHSWHDNAEAKWRCLQSWRQRYKEDHNGVEPKLWIDKYCIDQTNITESLACLPNYLSGCKKLVVLCGETYLERLWCLVEIFVHLEFEFDSNHFEVHLLGDKRALAPVIRNFSIDQARCYTEADTARLKGVIDAGGALAMKKLENFVQEKFLERDEVPAR